MIHCQRSCEAPEDVSLLQHREVDAVKVAAHWNTSQLKTTPKALTVTDGSKSTTRALSPQRQEDSKCLLSQSGEDGIGHQLEGKLSCMAMASFLGMEYVHKPFFTMQHVGNPGEMAAFFEEFFGLGTQFRSMKAPMREQYIDVPQAGHCWENGWLRLVELGERKCEGPNEVIAPDDCWDRMYCHGYMESGHFYKLVRFRIFRQPITQLRSQKHNGQRVFHINSPGVQRW